MEDRTRLPREGNRRGVFRKGRREPLAEEDRVGSGPAAGEPRPGAGGRVRGWPRAVTRPGLGQRRGRVAASHGASGLRGAVWGLLCGPENTLLGLLNNPCSKSYPLHGWSVFFFPFLTLWSFHS